MTGPLDIHFIAIGGTGMAPTACLLEALGHRVQGSDKPLYPPMSDLLAAQQIEPLVGFDPGHLEPPPDLVVVGNAVPRDNPEAVETERRGLPRMSMPEALYRFCLADRRRWVVAGTHGKTTTTSMAAWALHDSGVDPGFLVGGIPEDLGTSFRLGTGDPFVIEGDEYNASYFDRGPKFLHYRPDVLILTSVEHDHADLYPSIESLHAAYAELVSLVPKDGVVVACGESADLRRVVSGATSSPVYYGFDDRCQITVRGPVIPTPEGTRCRLVGPGGAEAELALAFPGRHNLLNAMAVWGAGVIEGGSPADLAGALSRFRGVKRRLEVVASPGDAIVVDDFAHHPTAVAATLSALRQRYPGRRVVAVFEPRSLTAGRSFFQAAYREVFSGADAVVVAPVFYAGRLDDGERLDIDALCADLGAGGTEARAATSLDEVVELAAGAVQSDDIVVCMSSGSFGGMPARIAAALTRPVGGGGPE